MPNASAQQQKATSVYRNPILFSDYSDPDVIRDGDAYYLVASSFHFVPGLPILKSTDLVHWTILGHALPRITIDPHYDMAGGNRYGRGVWAPAIRKHNGLFYIYFPTPDEGIFVVTAPKIEGPWSKPVAVIAGPNLEDPCPFWDDDGKAYLVHSRTGAGPLVLHRMAADGMSVLDDGKEIVRDPNNLPTLEGPKLYKRNGYYYIFAPFGGVSKGSQAVLRSRSIDGPYEHRVVLAQGATAINGPHQGAYVETPDGQGWFVHFQSREAHGRIVHLEPVRWEDDWPIVGQAPQGATTGEPVSSWETPHYAGAPSHERPQTSDEFNESRLGPQWQWNHNPDDGNWSLTKRPGFLRLVPMKADGLLDARNTLTQQMQDESFELTVRIELEGMRDGAHAGIAMLEKAAGGIQVVQAGGGRGLKLFHGSDVVDGPAVDGKAIQLRLRVEGNQVTYFYSLDEGRSFRQLGETLPITFSWWKGSRPSLFAYATRDDAGAYVDFDWVRYTALTTP
ncbi:MAG TPA: glycoside hydrolase 43 family protein [Edaphobacter sp.]